MAARSVAFGDVIVTPTAVKLGPKGKLLKTPDALGELLATLPKGERRKIRKQLRTNGKINLAAARAA